MVPIRNNHPQSLQTKSRSNNGDNRHDDDTGDADEDDAGKHDDTTRLLRVSPNTTTTTTTTTKTSTLASYHSSQAKRISKHEHFKTGSWQKRAYHAYTGLDRKRNAHLRGCCTLWYCSLLTVADSTELRFTPPAAARKAV